MKVNCVVPKCSNTAHLATVKSKWYSMTLVRKGAVIKDGWMCPTCKDGMEKPKEEKAVKPEYEKRDDE